MRKQYLPGALCFSLMLVAAIAAGIYGWIIADLPILAALPDHKNAPSIRITDRNGNLLYEILGDETSRNAVVPLEAFQANVVYATIATEDRSFYSNAGIDPYSILRAMWTNLQNKSTVSGGSTITQQVARNLLLNPEERNQRTLRRKIREAILALQLTRRFTKDEILSLYLNQTYYGSLAYGVEAASLTFFGKPAAQLDLAESALLAGLPQAPASYDPFKNLEAAIERQRKVLDLMLEAGFIDSQQRAAAGRQRLILSDTPYPIKAPHFAMMVKDEVESMLTRDQIRESGGLVVRTTLNLEWQAHAESAVSRQLAALQNSDDFFDHNVNNAALVAIDPHNGDILALVGSPDYFDGKNNGSINMALAPRQPGSALKPFIYASAMNPANREPWTAATMLLDVNTSFVTREGKAYMPVNYDRKEHGPVSLRQALASSLNIPAVIALDHIGLEELFRQTSRIGISTLHDPERYDLSLALGGGDVRLLELTAAYGMFASEGLKVVPHPILEISDTSGNILFEYKHPTSTRVLDERLAWLISDILSDNSARQLGFGAHSALLVERPAAVKTGTTSNFHDNWTIGYTPSLVVGVWTGNASYQPMRTVDGLSGAAPIWHSFLRTVLSGTTPEPFKQPQGLVQVEVCSLSGLLPTQACPYTKMEWFIDGTQPTRRDNLYQLVEMNSVKGTPAEEGSPGESQKLLAVLNLPPEAAAWAHNQGLTLFGDLELHLQQQPGVNTADLNALATGPVLRIVSPAQGSHYLIDPSFIEDAQRIPLEGVVEGNLREISLWIDGEIFARLNEPPYLTWWQLTPGKHTVWVQGIDTAGNILTSEQVVFEVIHNTD